jgi:tetratricopeptide (TPR) repeat protein
MRVPGRALRFKLIVAGAMALASFGFVVRPISATAQAALDYTEKKQHALELYRQNKMVAAAAELEKLAAINDKDVEVFSDLGFALFSSMEAAPNDAEKARLADRARAALIRAKELGDKSDLTDLTLAKLKERTATGPTEPRFSANPEANLAMQQAEAHFVKGELDQAIALYEKALIADPKLYDAALYIGDAYYKSPGGIAKAPEWFAKAVTIDPDRETAYRYWADVLMKQGDTLLARDKYVEAFISEPNNRLAVSAFTRWGQNQHLTLAHPAITIPSSVSKDKAGNTTINIDPSTLGKQDNGSSAWIMYGISRAAWSGGEFQKEYPDEKTYRHSLKEEAQALRMVISAVNEKSKHSKDLDPSLATIIKLDQQGELEAYILLARSDEGIARDYPAYLKAHRDQLRAYVMDWVLRGGHAK